MVRKELLSLEKGNILVSKKGTKELTFISLNLEEGKVIVLEEGKEAIKKFNTILGGYNLKEVKPLLNLVKEEVKPLLNLVKEEVKGEVSLIDIVEAIKEDLKVIEEVEAIEEVREVVAIEEVGEDISPQVEPIGEVGNIDTESNLGVESSLGITLTKEELKSYIEDNSISLESNIKKVLIVKEDYTILKGDITFKGDYTIKLAYIVGDLALNKIKEENIFYKDILGIFNIDIDLKLLEAYLKDLKASKVNTTIEEKEPFKKASKGNKKDLEEGTISLKSLVEELVLKDKAFYLDLEFNSNNTFKYIRRVIRKKGNLLKSLRLEGYNYLFLEENKEALKEELILLFKR